MSSYIDQPLQGPPTSGANRHARVWAHIPGVGALIIADFGASPSIDVATKMQNARRAVACWNFCRGVSTERLEEMMKNGGTIADLMKLAKAPL